MSAGVGDPVKLDERWSQWTAPSPNRRHASQSSIFLASGFSCSQAESTPAWLSSLSRHTCHASRSHSGRSPSGTLTQTVGLLIKIVEVLMPEKPTVDEILDAIKASGYLMEQEVGSMLESHQFIVITNWAFIDADESKSRELDVFARKTVYRNDTSKLKIIVELLCECKNYQLPFVFISRKKNKLDNRRTPQEYLFPLNAFALPVPDKENTIMLVDAFHHLGLDQHHYYYKSDDKVVQFSRILRKGRGWEANHADIYDDIFYKLIKALLARKKEVEPGEYRNIGDDWQSVWLLFPIVVLSGEMFLIDSSTENPTPRAVHHITFVRDIQSATMKGEYVLDFVTLQGLNEFIESISKEFIERII